MPTVVSMMRSATTAVALGCLWTAGPAGAQAVAEPADASPAAPTAQDEAAARPNTPEDLPPQDTPAAPVPTAVDESKPVAPQAPGGHGTGIVAPQAAAPAQQSEVPARSRAQRKPRWESAPAHEAPPSHGPPEHESDSLGSHSLNATLIGVHYGYMHDSGLGFVIETVYTPNDLLWRDRSELELITTGAGFRYYWSQMQDSGFVGLTVSYATGTARYESDGGVVGFPPARFEFDAERIAFTASLGRRWAWDNGFNITWRLGLGAGTFELEPKREDPGNDSAQTNIENAMLFTPPLMRDGELSLGIIF